ncbi:uncharacterized protein with PQ loop repeat [Filimonas zeae]|nr:hypothetical protein [Filimonas zeae]MDR6340676.1 uncharacterized protein with PQ loop repeat [Filimonas zeae]
MRILTFLSRVALLCGVFFLICLVLRIYPFTSGKKDLEGFLIIMGWILAPLVNMAVCVWLFALALRKKPLPVTKPVVLLHIVLFVLQSLFIFLK